MAGSGKPAGMPGRCAQLPRRSAGKCTRGSRPCARSRGQPPTPSFRTSSWHSWTTSRGVREIILQGVREIILQASAAAVGLSQTAPAPSPRRTIERLFEWPKPRRASSVKSCEAYHAGQGSRQAATHLQRGPGPGRACARPAAAAVALRGPAGPACPRLRCRPSGLWARAPAEGAPPPLPQRGLTASHFTKEVTP